MGGPASLHLGNLNQSNWKSVKDALHTVGRGADGQRVFVDTKGGKVQVLYSRDLSASLIHRIQAWFQAKTAKASLLEWAHGLFPQLAKQEVKRLLDERAPQGKMTVGGLKNLIDTLAGKFVRSRSDTRQLLLDPRALGTGGLGEVYAAKTPDGEHSFAVKKAKDGHQGALDAELRIHKKLMLGDHTHIVQLQDDFVDAHGERVAVMEKMKRSLANHLEEVKSFAATKNLPLPPGLAQSAFFGMVKGVQQMHAQGVAHGDIKPENFLVGPDGIDQSGGGVKVADFGSAWEPKKSDWNLIGSLTWMAPEMLQYAEDMQRHDEAVAACMKSWEKGELVDDPAPPISRVAEPADVFALGLSALHVLGIHPNGLFGGDGDGKALARGFLTDMAKLAADNPHEQQPHLKKLEEIGVSTAKVPTDLYALLTWMLHPDPDRRPTMEQVENHPYFDNLRPKQQESS